MLFILHSITSVETRVKTFLLVSFELVFFERDTHTHAHTEEKKNQTLIQKKRFRNKQTTRICMLVEKTKRCLCRKQIDKK